MDWFLYDNGLRHERVKHFGTETRAFVQKNSASASESFWATQGNSESFKYR